MLDRMSATPVAAEVRVTWTPELVDELRRLRAAGYKTTEIADRFGMTKNQIVGAASRYNLERPKLGYIEWSPELVARTREMWDRRLPAEVIGAEIGCSKANIWKTARRFKFTRRYKIPGVRSRPKLPVYIPTNIADTEIPTEQRVSFMDLSEHTCRWPVGEPGTPEFFFCGAAPFESRPYCPLHCARAYRNDAI